MFDIAVAALPFLMGFAMVFGVLGLRMYFFFRRLSRHREQTQRARAEGTFAPPSFLLGKQLPVQYEALAKIGTGGNAPVTIDERILRPAIGVRLFVAALAAAIIALAVKPDMFPTAYGQALAELPVQPILLQVGLIAAALWSLVYIFGFEARYNTDQLIVTRLFKRREYRWKDLAWLKDDGGYDLVLTFERGGKAKILKHSVGVAEFMAFAEGQAKRNRNIHA